MATPYGAIPRDLEQRLRSIEQQLRDVAGAALYRRQLNLTSGDFTVEGGSVTVRGGGGVTVEDGGGFVAKYTGGGEAVTFGPATVVDGRSTQALWLKDENVHTVFAALRTPYDAAHPEYPDGQRVVQIGSGSQTVETFYCNAATVQFVGLPGNAAAANVYVDGNGMLWRSTSSRRYKQDVATAEVDVDAALQLTPRRFRSKAEVEQHGDDAPTHVGFIAEEAADLGLDAWVSEDEQGPESFAYAQWCVAQQAIIRRQQEQLDSQAAQIAALTARLDALA